MLEVREDGNDVGHDQQRDQNQDDVLGFHERIRISDNANRATRAAQRVRVGN